MKRTSTRILLTCAAIGVAFGLVGLGNSVLMIALFTAAPAFYPVLSGVHIVPGVIAIALLQRPGVGILTQAIAGLVAIGGTSALMAPGLAFVLFGIVLELPYLVTRYRVWSVWPTYVAAGLVGALAAFGSFALLDGSSLPPVIVVLAPVAIIVATLLWAFVARWLAAALRRSGLGGVVPQEQDRKRRPG